MSSAAEQPLILVIEDEEDVCDMVCHALERADFRTLAANSAYQGAQFAEKRNPTAILLDLMLARLDGFDVLKRLKEIPRTSSIPVVILSAKNEPSDRIRAFELGADDYIPKPFNTRELALRLKAVLRRQQPVVESLSAGDLIVDPVALRVRIKGRPLDLALMEFKLLCSLLSNAGVIIPREELLRTVWGEDVGVDIRSVDTYIYRLRTKLGDHGRMVKTVRSVGYVFEKPAIS